MCVYYTLFPSFSFNNKRPRNLLSETRKQAEAEAAAIAAAAAVVVLPNCETFLTSKISATHIYNRLACSKEKTKNSVCICL